MKQLKASYSMSTNEWMQFYQPSLSSSSGATIGVSSETNLFTPSTSKSSFHSQITDRLTPKGSSSKLIRRRSRASKKTPTTFLNANTSNFRALVQQFTGKRGGPISLNFACGSERNIQSGTATPIESASSGNDFYCQQRLQKQENAPHQQHQYFFQEQQHAVTSLFEGDASFGSCSGGANADQMVDGFDLDDIYSLQALNEDVFYSSMKMQMIPYIIKD